MGSHTTIVLSHLKCTCVFVSTWCARSVIFSELMPSSSASIGEVGNILSPIKTSRNNDWVKYGLSIVFYRSQSAHTQCSDVYKTLNGSSIVQNFEWLVHRILLFTVRAHAARRRIQNFEWLVHRILSFTVCAHAAHRRIQNFEWLFHRVLSFTVRAHATLRCIQNLNGLSIAFYCSQSAYTWRSDVYMTTDKCGPCSGLP